MRKTRSRSHPQKVGCKIVQIQNLLMCQILRATVHHTMNYCSLESNSSRMLLVEYRLDVCTNGLSDKKRWMEASFRGWGNDRLMVTSFPLWMQFILGTQKSLKWIYRRIYEVTCT